MNFYNLVIAIVFFLIYCEKVQSQYCNRNPDTSHCYIKEIFKPIVTGIEKKLEQSYQNNASSIQFFADVNGDCKSELITFSRRGDSILIIDLISFAMIKKFPISYVDPVSHSLLLVDLDKDSSPEAIIHSVRNPTNPDNYDSDRLICYRMDGSILWISDTTVNAVNNGNARSGSIGICDFNQDGIPEIYTSNKIFNALTGKKLADGGNNGFGYNSLSIGFYGPISVVANLDSDTSDLELAAGFSIYKVIITNPKGISGNMMIANNFLFNGTSEDGNTSLADINSDGILDVIVSAPSRNNDPILYAYYLDNNIPSLIGYARFPNAQQISHASIGKLNGTGNPSILVNISTKMFSFRFNGSQLLSQDWTINTTDTSGVSGILLFDIDGDGIQEIIFRDMTYLKIISGIGSSPFIRFQSRCYSATLREFPTITDYPQTGEIKICITCNDSGPFYRNPRITVFGPPNGDRWAPARGIWNQYAYNPLFINDDLTVPRVQKNQATYKNGKYNNFMQQESLLDSNGYYKRPAASLTGKIQCINYDPQLNEYHVIFDLYNRKDASHSADSGLSVTFYNGDPSNGGTFIGIYSTLKSINPGDSLLNLQFKFIASNLRDLFMVINTIRNGNGNFEDKDFLQAECDYTDNISRTIELPKLDSIQAMICKGGSYAFIDTSIRDAGKYYRKISNTKGCDSLIVLLNLMTVDTVHTHQTIQACDAYIWNNKSLSQTGNYQFDTLNQFGCDSIVNLDLVIHQSTISQNQQTACNKYQWNGKTYNQSGTYLYQTTNSFGCDSIATLELIIHKSDTINLIVTTCNNYSWNGRNYLQSGIYTLDTINQFGCDSVVQLNLNINSMINVSIPQTACDSYIWNGKMYKQSGNYIDTMQSSKGCDSITTLQLKINQSSVSNMNQTICDAYVWNGNTYTQSGNYSFKTQNANGCDSTANLQLTINKSSQSASNVSSCNSYLWNNINYTQSGSYTFKTQNASGCDSTATLNLVIHQSDSLIQPQSACDKYNWNNKTYTQSGKYTYQTTNRYGCDSINILDLNILKSTTKDTSIDVCDSINFLNKTLKADGNYSFTIPNAQGCDSVINLNLNINSQILSESITKCGSYFWNGRTYDSSGIYREKYSNSVGCDSIHELNLIIHKHYDIQEKAEVCKEYRWPVNKQVYTQSGEYSYPLKTTQGCDSILTLELTINPAFKQIDTVIATSDYLWPVNQKIYPASGTYEEDYTSSKGCDSIHLLLLTIDKEVSIYYPNVIHPGGVNEWFTIFVYGHVARIKVLSIYDRWGELVWQKESFQPNELPQGWNGQFKGKHVLPGVYVWYAEIELQDGRLITEKGDVTVLR